MTYSIKEMEERTEFVRIRRVSISHYGDPRALEAIDAALEVIAELSGRLSAAEELLVEARADARRNAGGRSLDHDSPRT